MTKETKPGEYYTRNWRGQLDKAEPGTPDVVICRRIADYPDGQPPAGAAHGVCVYCGAPLAYNPASPHQDRPRSCMQCAGIQPLPFDS